MNQNKIKQPSHPSNERKQKGSERRERWKLTPSGCPTLEQESGTFGLERASKNRYRSLLQDPKEQNKYKTKKEEKRLIAPANKKSFK